ncbi:MAG TPA: phosphopantetheine-binding protein [Aquabacterium sp.]|nr:phosphopantetheine-binding protein [Aquabacterium sp.]
MSDIENLTLNLVRKALTQYVDAPMEQMTLDASLQDLQVDSLTLAELLFEIEDRLGVQMADTATPPKTVGDLVALVMQHIDVAQIDATQLKNAA